jgi:hypothetical protein
MCATIASTAFGQALSGLSGTVSDSSKSVIAGVKVTVTNLATGASRSTVTASSGFYSFPNLAPGIYSVRVEAAGFQSDVNPSVTLSAAIPGSADFSLRVGDVNTVVTVESIAPELDRSSASLGDTMKAQTIEQLPINGRDYARLSLLTPGAVARSRYISDISFDGLHTVHNQYSIDGVDASRVDQPYMANGFERGARLLTGSLETIAEFRAQTSGYQAEYGRSAGSAINIISKSGTNKFHGEAYDFFRNEALDARNFFARATKPRFRFNDFGGNFAGPIYKDKTFFFANYEGSRQQIGILGSGQVLSSTARATALQQHPELAPIINNEPIGVDNTPASNFATYSVVANTSVQENTGSIRIDHTFSPKDSLFGRFNVNETLTSGPLFGVTLSALGVNDHQLVPLTTTNIAIHEQHIFSPTFINDALIGLQRWASTINSAESIPQISITGIDAVVGSRGNTLGNNNSFQYGDAMTLVRRNHTIKWGGTYYRIQLHAKTITNASVLYTSVTDFENNKITQVTQTAGNPGHETVASQFGPYIQDNWQLRPNLTVNYGVRWDFETTPHDKFYATQTYLPSTGSLAAPGTEYFHKNYRDFGPRLGVAYSPTPRTVIRSGAGIFYQAYAVGFGSYYVPLNTLVGNLTLTQIANPGLSYPYTSFLSSGQAPATPNVYGFPSSKPDIYSTQYNLSVAQELTKGTSLQISYVGNHTVNIWRETDINLIDHITKIRPNTKFGDIYLEGNNGLANYNGLQVSLKERLSKSLNLAANYSYGHAIDNVQDQGIYSSEAQDNNNILAERGNGSGDVRQNFTYNLLYQLPMGKGHSFLGSGSAPVRLLSSGWSINSLGIFRTGVAENVQQSVNSYGNGDFINQRPDRAPGTPLYVAKTFTSKGYVTFLNPAGWQAPLAGTYGNSPRNGTYGPHFTQVDASLLKDTEIREGQTLEFRAEFFNILNHPNFGFPTTAFGSSSFGSITSTFGNTIGFGTSRQIEFALKYKF